MSSSLEAGQIDIIANDIVKFTGSQINYYFICKRKLWLFSHNIELEPESDLVKLGKLLHENSYQRKMKEVQVERIKVDFLEHKRTSFDSKKSFPEIVDPRVKSTSFSEPREETKHTQNSEIVIHEIKRSKKMQDAHVFQLLYYIYYLSSKYSVNTRRGVLHYPLLKQNVDVVLDEARIKELEEAIHGMQEINALASPPEASWKRYCSSCAYQYLCWG